MQTLKLACVTLTGLLLAAGCDREQASTPAPAPQAAPVPAPAPSAGATADVPATAPSLAGDRMVSGARSAVDGASAGARDAGLRGADAASAAQTQAAATAQLTTEQAKTMLDQAVNYVKQNKYDLAEKTLNQVEAQKDSLPKSIQDYVGTVRTMLATAKAGGGLQIPGLGGGASK